MMSEPGKGTAPAADEAAGSGGGSLRADAARNVAQIRAAALTAFRGRGLGTPLAQVAAAAGVSKATIYNHFGGRKGLIDAVIEELVTSELYSAMDAARRADDPWERISGWVGARRDLQYREPAFTDVMLATYSESEQLARLAKAVTDATAEIVEAGRDSGVLRADLTPGDLFWADVANGLALREMPRPRREDYDRRTRHFLDSLRPR
ncbi:TetR/AcrR family transcriptional regulator [Actinoallomurus soli]|uniref:TetR/AcrR family transcriptional regulator n=1 Tax=Actinoallomurus soli TaxID=2952535 RepID=UPI002093B54F|nr:TetR/AcrR family transcriptional regulator [Actinoallomurus soli]MCO5973864.1 TetR/AcrR family transcriptional regulator [Actinoallomurus soli]